MSLMRKWRRPWTVFVALLAWAAPSFGRLAAVPAGEKPIQIVISVDWEGDFLDPANLRAIQKFRADYPWIKIVHFLNAAYFTKANANAQDIQRQIRSVLRQGDEIGLHIHGQRSLITAAGVTFRAEPSYLPPSTEKVLSSWDLGHDVALTAYTTEELRKIIRTSLDILKLNGFGGISIFRAGGWLAGPNVLEALAREGLRQDSSAVPLELMQMSIDGFPMLKDLWGQVTPITPAYDISTPAGTITEQPNTAGMADHVSGFQAFRILRRQVAAAEAGRLSEVRLHYGFHQETAAVYLARVRTFLRLSGAYAWAKGAKLTSVTLTGGADKNGICAHELADAADTGLRP